MESQVKEFVTICSRYCFPGIRSLFSSNGVSVKTRVMAQYHLCRWSYSAKSAAMFFWDIFYNSVITSLNLSPFIYPLAVTQQVSSGFNHIIKPFCDNEVLMLSSGYRKYNRYKYDFMENREKGLVKWRWSGQLSCYVCSILGIISRAF